MKLFIMILPLLLQPIWSFGSTVADAISDPPPLSSISAAPFPSIPYGPTTSPVSSSMAASSPVIQAGGEENQMDSHKKIFVALIVASAALGLTILVMLSLWIHKKYCPKPHKSNAHTPDAEKARPLGPLLAKFNTMKVIGTKGAVSFIDYKLLETATTNFHESNILGEGGFGCVYKARLDDNFHVAVKKVDGTGQDAEREFENEVTLLTKIQHPNIISLLGYSRHEESKFLVYELMQNGSLETQLHGPSHGSSLNWLIRMKVALDTARGLEYLHEHCNPPVIHRDLKSSNILLDSNFNAKLSDFGLAVIDGPQNKNNLKLSGTLGYLAPEYLLDGEYLVVTRSSFPQVLEELVEVRASKLTDKSDVYAFGVVLLELLLGRKPVEKLAPAQCQSIVTWAMPQLTDRSKLPGMVDPAIRDTMDLKHLYQVAAVAVLCVQPEPSYRPLITDVLHSLIPLVPVELGGMLKLTQKALPPPPDTTAVPSATGGG